MNNRKMRAYVNGTSALKIQSRDDSRGNVVCLGRSKDGRLFVDEAAVQNRVGQGMPLRNEAMAAEPTLRDDLRVAYHALGLKGMSRNLQQGSAAGQVLSDVNNVRGLLFGAALFLVTLAVVLI